MKTPTHHSIGVSLEMAVIAFFIIDVRNAAVEIAKRMGIWSDLQQKITTLDEVSFSDARNRRISGINVLTLHNLHLLARARQLPTELQNAAHFLDRCSRRW